MVLTLTLGSEHALVLLAALSYWLVNQVLGAQVSAARNRFKIPLPNLYANGSMFLKNGQVDEALMKTRGDAFNQVQRGHQHMAAELQADAYMLLLTSALANPTHAAYCGFAYAVGSLLYGLGYGRFGPKARYFGELVYIPGMIYQAWMTGSLAYRLYYS